jgi:four helix bundle protein
VRNFKTYTVWEKAHRLTVEVYAATVDFPKEELYGLRSQIRRSCVSVPANIAEGCGRGSDADFARFLHVSAGFANELQYHLLLARDLGFLERSKRAKLDAQVDEVKRMLTTLTRKLQR